MVYINQIFLNKYGIKKNKRFLKALYENENLIGISKWFDFKNGIQRQNDYDMSLEKFLELINSESMLRLQFASPDSEKIRYCARHLCEDSSKFAWIICPYNDNNFREVSRLFEESFGERLI